MKTSWDNLSLEISEKKKVLWKAIFTKPINNIYVYLGEFQQIIEFFLKDISLLATLKFEVYVCIYALITTLPEGESHFSCCWT